MRDSSALISRTAACFGRSGALFAWMRGKEARSPGRFSPPSTPRRAGRWRVREDRRRPDFSSRPHSPLPPPRPPRLVPRDWPASSRAFDMQSRVARARRWSSSFAPDLDAGRRSMTPIADTVACATAGTRAAPASRPFPRPFHRVSAGVAWRRVVAPTAPTEPWAVSGIASVQQCVVAHQELQARAVQHSCHATGAISRRVSDGRRRTIQFDSATVGATRRCTWRAEDAHAEGAGHLATSGSSVSSFAETHRRA